jgi:hypothetical protein
VRLVNEHESGNGTAIFTPDGVVNNMTCASVMRSSF